MRKGIEYRVRWEIDVLAPNPRKAAEIALAIQRDAGSTATCFEVWKPRDVVTHAIDLQKED